MNAIISINLLPPLFQTLLQFCCCNRIGFLSGFGIIGATAFGLVDVGFEYFIAATVVGNGKICINVGKVNAAIISSRGGRSFDLNTVIGLILIIGKMIALIDRDDREKAIGNQSLLFLQYRRGFQYGV